MLSTPWYILVLTPVIGLLLFAAMLLAVVFVGLSLRSMIGYIVWVEPNPFNPFSPPDWTRHSFIEPATIFVGALTIGSFLLGLPLAHSLFNL